jgi:uncharacterized protein with GYD domain
MQTYVILMNLTDEGIKNVKEAPTRLEMTSKALEAVGGKLVGFYATMGQYDYITIAEGPDDETAFIQLLTLGMLGNVRTVTLKAFSQDKFLEIVKKLP